MKSGIHVFPNHIARLIFAKLRVLPLQELIVLALLSRMNCIRVIYLTWHGLALDMTCGQLEISVWVNGKSYQTRLLTYPKLMVISYAIDGGLRVYKM